PFQAVSVLSLPPFAPAQAPDGTTILLNRANGGALARLVSLSADVRRQGVVLNGELYLSGGVLTKWSGVIPSEPSFLAPVIVSATPSNSTGSLTASSSYSYRAFLEWTDAQGRVHQGEVSIETDATTGVGEDTMTLVVQ